MIRRRPQLAGVFALAFLAGPLQAGSLVTGGYQEAIFSVSDATEYVSFFEQVAGWTSLYSGDVDATILAAWGLPETVSARQIVVANPGTTRGYVRLVEFAGAEQLQIRSGAQSWDTGGYFDVNSRVINMDTKFVEMQARDWQASSDPVQFGFGPFEVKEWLARGPDGIVLALIERIKPPLEGWPHLREMSRLFNATQVVADIDSARDFYVNKLGFEVYLEHVGASRVAGPNVLGMPYNIATEIPRHVYIVHPDGSNEGSVELLHFEGLDGADYSARAIPPNLGILMLRFPVADIDAFAAHISAEDIEVAMPPTNVMLEPYGPAQLMAVRGPGGVWLEFFELE